LKLFHKTVFGNSEYYPEQVKRFSVKLGREKVGKETSMDMAEYLEEAWEDITSRLLRFNGGRGRIG
jgi:hypothetical protein